MATAGDVADAWEKNRQETEKILEQYLDRNPNWKGIIVAGSVKTTMDLGAGFVDVLRLGQGAAEGGWGWGKDALRLVGLVGPLGRAAKLVQAGRGVQTARLIADPGGPVCSWVSSTKALSHTGQKLFASVDDLALAITGRSISQLGGIPLEAMVAELRTIGAVVGEVKLINSVSQIQRMLPRDGSVVLISVNGMKNGVRAGGHAFYAFYDTLGRLRFMDRSGVYSSIDDVAAHYSTLVDEFVLRAGAPLKNIFLKFVGPKGTATLAMEVNVLLMAQEESSPQQQPAPVVNGPQQGKPPSKYPVQPGDSLSKIAGQFYRDVHLWPLLWDANRGVIGPNPNRTVPGQQLTIPELSSYTPMQLAEFRKRSPTWRNFR